MSTKAAPTAESTPVDLHDEIGSMLAQMREQETLGEPEQDSEIQEDDAGDAAEAADVDDPEEEEHPEVEVDEDGIPTDVTELRRGFLRESDYTKKTQALAQQRQELAEGLAEIEALKAQYTELLSKGATPGTAPAADDDSDLPEDATAEQIVEHIVNKRVAAMLEEKLGPVAPQLESEKFLKNVEKAWDEFVAMDGTDPIFQTQSVAKAVGDEIEGNEALLALARTDPAQAIKIAASLVDVDKPKARTSKAAARKAATKASSVRSRNGTTRPAAKQKSLMEITREAMLKAGMPL